MFVIGIEPGPDFFQGIRPPVVEVGRGFVDIVEMGDIENAMGIEVGTGSYIDEAAVCKVWSRMTIITPLLFRDFSSAVGVGAFK
jgi:hypothetical protein